ncbi:MAG: hypothetical protein ACREIV_05615, partial [Planctomycetaceae bacterium]
LFGSMAFGPLVSTAAACPMCKQANETDDRRPKAYMYSILFMISMPAMMVGGFGFTFYRLSKKQAAINEEALSVDSMEG